MVLRHPSSALTVAAAFLWEGKQGPAHGFVHSERRHVMRLLSAVLSLAVVVALCTSVNAGGTGVVVVERIQDLDLTDAQEAKIAEIRKEFRPRVEKAVKQLTTLVREELEGMHAVFTPEQKDKLKALKDERRERRFQHLSERIAHLKELDLTDAEMAKIREIRKEVRPRIVQALKELEGLLSAEQKQARVEGLKAGKPRREIRRALKLTDEQKQKVEAVAKEVGAAVREEMARIRDVLTESQKEQLAELKEERRERVRDHMAHRIMHLKDLNLTEAQKSSLTKVREEYRARIHEAASNLRATIREEVGEILGVIKR
jgi:Spy/CpxP family protein refolding chaperone